MMIAHIRESDGAQQPLADHLRQVSALCASAARPFGLEHTARLLGLLHDMGKATEKFRDYLLSALDAGPPRTSPHPHAPTGAMFVYERWFLPSSKPYHRLTAQMLALCIHGHHAGLANCLDPQGNSAFLDAMEQAQEPLHTAEAVARFYETILPPKDLDVWFQNACAEVEAFSKTYIQPNEQNGGRMFDLGMLTRLLLSILVDADRWDSACFEHGGDAASPQTSEPDWKHLLDTFETFRKEHLNGEGEINQIRAEISDACFSRATAAPGIYELCVPTGGGKTYSSLRFALRHAMEYGKKRIFYIIPFNTILDQNAQDIREALSDYPSILEHHCNVIQSTEEEQKAYRLLTERWDSDIILTSLVQFLNACFTASNTDARRLYRLSNAVLIFDEIQALPKKCKTLFERAISFLSRCCNTTVVLCTATQPRLELVPEPVKLVAHEEALFQRMKRVRYLPQLEPSYSNEVAAARIASMLEEQSVLTIVNTKRVALDVYQETVRLLREAGKTIVSVELSHSEEEMIQLARQSGSQGILCVHLSTMLCPAHRKKLITWIKLWLREGARVLCVSTALIEAGINVSFPVVIRSLTGLPSIVQAAGRANRNMEYGTGVVHIWKFQDENLDRLRDIKKGAICTRQMLKSSESEEKAFDLPSQIEIYFKKEDFYTKDEKDYPIEGQDSLFSLLSNNQSARNAGNLFEDTRRLILSQRFRKAYEAFAVIPDETVPVLVPFGEGQDLIEQLNGTHTMEEEIFWLRKAQGYTVSLYRNVFQRLADDDAIWPVGQTGALALKEGYYDLERGVILERAELELLAY